MKIKVPASTSNIGPGFDCLGLAISKYLYLSATPSDKIEIIRDGTLRILNKTLPHLNSDLIILSYKKIFDIYKEKVKPIKILAYSEIPIARGLGSSASAIVGGLALANIIIGKKFNRNELLQIAMEIEGHPDNVSAAIFGGFTSSFVLNGKKIISESIRFSKKLNLIAVIPEFELNTKKAREILPKKIPIENCIYNMGRISFLRNSLERGNTEFLRYALEDKIHQPYRSRLIPGFSELVNSAVKEGACGTFISGSGPSIIAILDDSRKLQKVGKAMVSVFQKYNIKSKYEILRVSEKGYIIR